MPVFSQRSKDKLYTCHHKLRRVMEQAIKVYDFSVICGHRGNDEQNDLFNQGRSKVQFPDSKHNLTPSCAVDIVPYLPGHDIWNLEDPNILKHWYLMAGVVLATAESMWTPLRWGGDWNRDMRFDDNKFNDLPHFELQHINMK